MSLISELQRRKVFKVAGAYLVVGWLLIQVAATVAPQLNLPEWAPRFITLVVLLGFPIVVVMAWVFDVTPEGIKVDASRAGSKRIFVVAAALAALALGWYFHRQAEQAVPAMNAKIATAPVATIDTHSIAVLPFVDMSQNKDQEYFSDGLSEELLNLLAQLPQMRVIARTSSFSFKGQEVDVATIAKKLNVANVLEGSVRKSGNTLRITAQLIRASDSSHLWSQTYDRELTDVFKVQDEIAGAVVAALKVRLLPEQAMTNAHRSSNTEAYNQYLLGRDILNRGTLENWQRAADAFRKAIALDDTYAAAYAGLANAEGNIADRMGDHAIAEQALADGSKAIELAPNLADGYVSRGTGRLSFNKDWTGAQADFEKALALNSGDSNVQVGYGRLMIAFGRVPEAIAASRKASELDPLSFLSWTMLGRLFNFNGQYADARVALDRAVEVSPEADYANFHRGMTELLDGKAQAALAIFKDKTRGAYGDIGVAMAEHSLGHANESQQALDREIVQYAQGAAYQIAEVYAWRGEKDMAFEWLDRAYDQHDGGLTFIKTDPLVKSLVGDPRYAALMKKLGLPE
jgi:serine/threonine-protein kinase